MKKTISITLVLALCMVAKVTKADFTFGERVNLKSVIPVIDPELESITCFSYDGLEMWLASGRSGGQLFWALRRTSVNEDWGPPENVGPVDDQHATMPCVSSDGLTLYFCSTRAGGYGIVDIWVSEQETLNSPWQEPVNLGPQVNSSAVEGDPWISADNLELYFASNRPGGFGGNDIWVTKRATQNDPWSNPENLGSVVNSSYYDMSPCLSPDGLLLFFSGGYTHADRPGGFGGSDMWMTRRTSTSDSWQKPINLGPQVNSTSDEIVPRIYPDGSMLYFTTLTVTDGIWDWDNWQAPIIPVVDFNGDRIVDAEDMCIMVDHWGEDYPLCDIGPMPWGDGVVNVQDLIVLAEHLFEEFPPIQ